MSRTTEGSGAGVEVAADVPGPELDDVAVGIVDVERAALVVALEGDQLRVVPAGAQVLDRGVEVGLVDPQRARPTWGSQSPMRVLVPAITQTAPRPGQRSTTGRPSTST